MDDPETLAAGNGWTRDKYLAMGQEYMKANPNLFFYAKFVRQHFYRFFAILQYQHCADERTGCRGRRPLRGLICFLHDGLDV